MFVTDCEMLLLLCVVEFFCFHSLCCTSK